MTSLIKKITKAPWVLWQPLTKKPHDKGAQISDLFVWRCSQQWNTFFELIALPSLFSQVGGSSVVKFVFFNEQGKEFYTTEITVEPDKRRLVDIAKVLSLCEEETNDMGTFGVFHSYTPEVIKEHKSYLSERGYVSYQYKNSPLRSYVHGNLDALALSHGKISTLAARSFLNRKYCLQYVMNDNVNANAILVNPSDRREKITVDVMALDVSSNIEVIRSYSKWIDTKGMVIFELEPLPVKSRLVVRSKLIMARPLIFDYLNDKLNVFHG